MYYKISADVISENMFFSFLFLLSGYSSVDIEYGNYGRVYINHYDYGYNRYEVCSYSYSSRDGEALCRSKGYQYSYYST